MGTFRSSGGFTLVETMVAASIGLGVLLAITQAMTSNMKSSKGTSVMLDATQVQNTVAGILATRTACEAAMGKGVSSFTAATINPNLNTPQNVQLYQINTALGCAQPRPLLYSAHPVGTAASYQPTKDLRIKTLTFTKSANLGTVFNFTYSPTDPCNPSIAVERRAIQGKMDITLDNLAAAAGSSVGSPQFTRSFGLTLVVERLGAGSPWKIAQCAAVEGLLDNYGWDVSASCQTVNSPELVQNAPWPTEVSCPQGTYAKHTRVTFHDPPPINCGKGCTIDVPPHNDVELQCCKVQK